MKTILLGGFTFVALASFSPAWATETVKDEDEGDKVCRQCDQELDACQAKAKNDTKKLKACAEAEIKCIRANEKKKCF